MNVLYLLDLLIPGYAELPFEVRAAFQRTADGENLIDRAEELYEKLNSVDNRTIWETLRNRLFQIPEVSREVHIESAKLDLQVAMQGSYDYEALNRNIRKKELKSILTEWTLKAIERSYIELLNSTSKKHIIDAIKFDELNAAHAKSLVGHTSSLDEWARVYSESLQEQIKGNICLINGKQPFPNPPVVSKKSARDSLSKLYTYLSNVRNKNKEVKWCVESINKSADAHAFLQATGFATQNETSWLASFDIINYFRMAGQIAETKTIFLKFLEPFTPLYIEYSDINREQNVAKQILRTVMPLIIVSLAVILVAAMLSSFVIPEIAFVFILLPTIYLGLIAASGYVAAKNMIYNALCQHWFGGQFEIPEYQVSEAMNASFGSEKAIKVRQFYVEEIGACLTNENTYKTQTRLSQVEIDDRQENTNRRNALLLEWYDIHSNPHLSTDTAVDIFSSRLQLDGKATRDKLQTTLQEELATTLPAFTDNIANEVKTAVERTMHPFVSTTTQPRFFTRPACLEHREKLDRLYVLSNA